MQQNNDKIIYARKWVHHTGSALYFYNYKFLFQIHNKRPRKQTHIDQKMFKKKFQPKSTYAILDPPSWIHEFLELHFRFVIKGFENPRGRILIAKCSKTKILGKNYVRHVGSAIWISEFLEFDFRFVIRPRKAPRSHIDSKMFKNKNFSQKVRPPFWIRHLGFMIFSDLTSDS